MSARTTVHAVLPRRLHSTSLGLRLIQGPNPLRLISLNLRPRLRPTLPEPPHHPHPPPPPRIHQHGGALRVPQARVPPLERLTLVPARDVVPGAGLERRQRRRGGKAGFLKRELGFVSLQGRRVITRVDVGF